MRILRNFAYDAGALLAALARLGAYGQIARHPAASATSLAVIVTLVPLPAWAGGAPQFGSGGNTWVPRWVVNDHLGNAVLFVTEAGAEVKRRVFDPFGALIAQSETTEATARQFTGQSFEDSMGLYDFKARWYDPETGRFLSVDPVVQDPFDPQVLNPYGYVRNNPLNFVDPTGMTIMFAGINFGFGVSLTFDFGGIAAGQSGDESSPSSGGKGNKHGPDGRGQSGPTLGSWEGEVAKANSDALHRQWRRALDTILRALRSATDMALDIGPGFSLGGRGGGGGREESQSLASAAPIAIGAGGAIGEAGAASGVAAGSLLAPLAFLGVLFWPSELAKEDDWSPPDDRFFRVTTPGERAFQLRPGEEGVSVFLPTAVNPPLTAPEVLSNFRPGSGLAVRSLSQITALGLTAVPTPGANVLSPRLQASHFEIRRGPGMNRNQFKAALKTLSAGP